MDNRVVFRVSLVIMCIALLGMGMNWLGVSLPDWAVRVIGIVMLVDLVVLTYSSVNMKHTNIVKNANRVEQCNNQSRMKNE